MLKECVKMFFKNTCDTDFLEEVIDYVSFYNQNRILIGVHDDDYKINISFIDDICPLV